MSRAERTHDIDATQHARARGSDKTSAPFAASAPLPFGMTEKEAEVLRLIDRTRSTGEIARIVDRSIHTVEAQIKSARRRMGNVDRYRAADRFRTAEADSQSEVNPEPVMFAAPAVLDDVATDNPAADVPATERLREPRIALRDFASLDLPAPQKASRRDDPSDLTILVKIVGLALMCALLLLAAPQLAKGAQAITSRILPY